MSQRNFSIDAGFTFLSAVSSEAFLPRLVFIPQATFRLAVQNICTFLLLFCSLCLLFSVLKVYALNNKSYLDI